MNEESERKDDNLIWVFFHFWKIEQKTWVNEIIKVKQVPSVGEYVFKEDENESTVPYEVVRVDYNLFEESNSDAEVYCKESEQSKLDEMIHFYGGV